MNKNIAFAVRLSGLTIAVVSAVVFALVGEMPTSIAIALGILIGIVTLLVDLLISMELIRRDVLLALDLSAGALAESESFSYIRQISASLSALRSSGKPVEELFRLQARRYLLDCSVAMEGLSRGELLVDEPRRMENLIEFINSAKRSETILATSYVSLAEWWQTPLGEEYLRANLRASQRGVQIRRIFILRPRDVVMQRNFIEFQAQFFDVRIVDEALVLENLRENFLVVQGRLVSYADYSREGRLLRGHITTNGAVLRAYSEKFDSLRLMSVPASEYFLKMPAINTVTGPDHSRSEG